MHTLDSNSLQVSILDPIDDQHRFGTRYCTGGYIFQVSDPVHGDVMSGPTYPNDFDSYNGQGIPDAFNKAPLLPSDDRSHALVLGVGLCDLNTDTVVEFCPWDIRTEATSITMSTRHDHADHVVELTRTVSLNARTIRSHTSVTNAGKRPIPLSWFPHPFYPQLSDDDELCRFNIPAQFPDNEGFEQAASGFIARKDWPWKKGHFQGVDHDAQTSLIVQQKHPTLGLVGAICSYVPAFLPIWGNENTFSWEPYFERTVAQRQTVSWWIDYQF